jgi:superfamily II DNA helicase RecQ
MSAVVRHFGDLTDSRNPCGICDFCDPGDCLGQAFRPAAEHELRAAALALEELQEEGSTTTGRLHTAVFPSGEMLRDDFEQILGGLARAGYIRITEEVFSKDGRSIPYRKVHLTRAGETWEDEPLEIQIKTVVAASKPAKKRKAKSKSKQKSAAPKPSPSPAPVAAPPSPIEDKLRAWRLSEAKRRGVPAFRIFTDQSLNAMAANRPSTAAELLRIPGIGLSTVEKYGAILYQLLH